MRAVLWEGMLRGRIPALMDFVPPLLALDVDVYVAEPHENGLLLLKPLLRGPLDRLYLLAQLPCLGRGRRAKKPIRGRQHVRA